MQSPTAKVERFIQLLEEGIKQTQPGRYSFFGRVSETATNPVYCACALGAAAIVPLTPHERIEAVLHPTFYYSQSEAHRLIDGLRVRTNVTFDSTDTNFQAMYAYLGKIGSYVQRSTCLRSAIFHLNDDFVSTVGDQRLTIVAFLKAVLANSEPMIFEESINA